MESTIEITLHHILLLVRHLEHCNLPGFVLVVLMELGVPTKCLGFECLKAAIRLQNENPTRTLAKDIYAEIAQMIGNCSEEQVDQAIREVIKMAWKYGSQRAWDWYFSYDGKPVLKRPTNSEFISRVAYIMELWQECVNARRDQDEKM